LKKKNPNKQPAVFIDRDGTLIEEVNYLSTVGETRLFPFTKAAVEMLKTRGYLVIVVTNQSGIGRNIFDEKAMHSVHERIQSELNGAVDAFYFCPHLPCDGCVCRKPALGMIESAFTDFDIDLEGSWMVGDKKSDVETGRNAGIRSALVLTGYGMTHRLETNGVADLIAADLKEAVTEILAVSSVG
jgi:D-glycero-D-manno-heptose 1,7-bisphosphate phosphatase